MSVLFIIILKISIIMLNLKSFRSIVFLNDQSKLKLRFIPSKYHVRKLKLNLSFWKTRIRSKAKMEEIRYYLSRDFT